MNDLLWLHEQFVKRIGWLCVEVLDGPIAGTVSVRVFDPCHTVSVIAGISKSDMEALRNAEGSIAALAVSMRDQVLDALGKERP